MTATRPVTTPNLRCAPPCAKPADHHDTPYRDGRLFNAAPTKTAAPTNDTTRTRIDRHNTSDVRREGGTTPCALGVAGSWRPSAAGARRRTGGGRSYFRPSNAHTAPICVTTTTATFYESCLCHAHFFRAVLCARAAAGGLLRCVHGREAKGCDARCGV